jgi:hypothetical protein
MTVLEEPGGTPLMMMPPDAAGKTRILLDRTPPAKEVKLVLKNKVRVPLQIQRIRMELPRPVGTQDRGARLSIKGDKQIELLHGPAGAEQPVPFRDRFELSWEQTPNSVELAWRPYQREIVVQSTIDVTLHEHTAQIEQTLKFAREDIAGLEAKRVALEAPRGIDQVKLLPDGELLRPDARRLLWLPPSASPEKGIALQYDLDIAKARQLDVRPIWPSGASQKDVKVRVWSAAGVKARLTDDVSKSGVWKDRSIEVVPGRDQFPGLVLQGFGANLPLTLQLEDASTVAPAAFFADRALMQFRMLEDGSQQCRARYLIRKINARQVEVMLPLSLSRFREKPTFTLGGKSVQAEPIDQAERVLQVKLHPDLVATLPTVLEIKYTIPADALERNSAWRTTLLPPSFKSEVMIGQMSWHLVMPEPLIAASLGGNVRPNVRWAFQSWRLTPEAFASATDLAAWPDLAQEPGTLTYSFTRLSAQPETVYHLPWQWWLLGCSGLLLIVVLGGYLSPLPRLVYWLLLLAVAVAALAGIALFPGATAPVLFGSQPGALLCVIFVGIHLFVQDRYRRQLVFFPSFTRTKPGSTMVRMKAGQPREASTVDAPGTPAAADAPSASS